MPIRGGRALIFFYTCPILATLKVGSKCVFVLAKAKRQCNNDVT